MASGRGPKKTDPLNRGSNIRWMIENRDPADLPPRIPKDAAGMARLVGCHKSTISRSIRRQSVLADDYVLAFIESARLREIIPGIAPVWFDAEPAEFAQYLKDAGFGRWGQGAPTIDWVGRLPPLATARFMSESWLRPLLRPTTYRSDFGAPAEDAEFVDAAATIGERFGIVIDPFPDMLRAGLQSDALKLVILHRTIGHAVFDVLEPDPATTLHVIPGAGAAGRDLLVLAKTVKGPVSIAYGFEVGGITGRRELAVIIFGTATDLPRGWRGTPPEAQLAPWRLAPLAEAAEVAGRRGDLLHGCLIFDALPPGALS
ncbi:hypothetical protein P7L68_00830 (plasmid) [Tistrella mobilis]|jgi:hypothetical protein|uniref:hypothetical protein n=1 Tax=Tistrella mobilis TaxID=171437 RepID=UPI00355809CA